MRCVECGRRSQGGAAGWRAYLADDFEEDEEEGSPVEVVVYCAGCAEREFGPLLPRRSGGSDSDWPALPF